MSKLYESKKERISNGVKKILFMDHHSELGGGEIALLEIIKNLNRDKFFLFALLGNEGLLADELKKLNIEVIVNKLPDYFGQLDRDPKKRNRFSVFIKSALCLPFLIKSIKLIVVEKDIDIVYINSIKSSLYAIPAARQTKRRIIWHLHDCLSRDFYSLCVMPIIVFLTHTADQIICVSNIAKEYFIKAGGNPKKAKIIYNGVDIKRFNPDISAESIKRQLNLTGRKIVSIVGRLEPWKGQSIFIKAAKVICEKRDDISFLIIGGALFGFTEYEKELKTTVEQLNLKDKISFLGFRYDTEKIYAVSDVITHCSTKPEPFGRDIIEAMACAKPVISTNLGAPREIITDKKDGVLIEPADPETLAYEILKLIDNPQIAKTLGINARAKVEKLFDIVQITKQIEYIMLTPH